MFSIAGPDELIDNYYESHASLNFFNSHIKLTGYSTVSAVTECSALYINQYHLYKNVDKILKRMKNPKVIIDYPYEGGLSYDWRDRIINHYTSLKIPTENVLFILNSAAKYDKKDKKYNIHFFDYFAADAVRRSSVEQASLLKIDQRPLKLNLLIAKLKKIPRFLTLYHLYKEGLLNRTVLSLLCSDEDILFHKEQFPEIEENFYQDIKHYYGPAFPSLASSLLGKNDMGQTYTGWPNDARIYDRSSVSIICETSDRWGGWTPEFITEKTFRTILNRHPFVIHGAPGILKYLQSLGYKTFGSIIDETYDNSKEVNFEIIKQVNDAAIDLVKKIPNNTNEIQEIVNHNYDTLMKIGSNEITSLLDRIENFLKD